MKLPGYAPPSEKHSIQNLHYPCLGCHCVSLQLAGCSVQTSLSMSALRANAVQHAIQATHLWNLQLSAHLQNLLHRRFGTAKARFGGSDRPERSEATKCKTRVLHMTTCSARRRLPECGCRSAACWGRPWAGKCLASPPQPEAAPARRANVSSQQREQLNADSPLMLEEIRCHLLCPHCVISGSPRTVGSLHL